MPTSPARVTASRQTRLGYACCYFFNRQPYFLPAGSLQIGGGISDSSGSVVDVKKSSFINDQSGQNQGSALADFSSSLGVTSDVFTGDGAPIIYGGFVDGGNNLGLAYPPPPPSSPPPYPPLPPGPPAVPSCTGRPNGKVTLPSPSGFFEAYCYGGYVLLAKIDGRTQTWAYPNSLWTDGTTLNPGNLSLSQSEAKFPAFNQYPISVIRVRPPARVVSLSFLPARGLPQVGMANFSSSSIKWLSLPLGKSIPSLASAMAGGFVKTSAGRTAWKTLLGQPASLQLLCNQEGINSLPTAYQTSPGNTSVRLGILGNQENDCLSPDSAIGFGIQPGQGVPNLSAGDLTGATNIDGGVLPGANLTIPKFGFILGAP